METEETNEGDKETKKKPFREKLKDVNYRRKFYHTLVLFASFLVLGLCDTIHFPAFLDLAEITNTNIEQASVFYTSMSVGGLIGTLIMGFLFDKLPTYRSLLLAGANLGSAITITSIPWSSNYVLTIFLFFICYVFNLAFDTGTHADLLSMWGSDGKMFMQFLHFSYAIGSILSPLIVEPFLGHTHRNTTSCIAERIPYNTIATVQIPTSNTTEISYNETSYSSDVTNQTTSQDCVNYESRIHYAYLIAGIMCFVTAMILVAEAYIECIDTRQIKTNEDPQPRPSRSKQHSIIILVVIIIFYILLSAPGNTIPGYLMPFGVDERGWKKESTAYLTSIYWSVFAAARLAAVFAIKFMSATKLMTLCLVLLIVTMSGLWVSVVVDSDPWVWACIIASSGGFSVSFPTGFIYVEKNIMKVTGMVASVMMLATNAAGIVNPLILGNLMEEVSKRWYIYLTLAQVIAAFALFVLLHLMVKFKRFSFVNSNAQSNLETQVIEETGLNDGART